MSRTLACCIALFVIPFAALICVALPLHAQTAAPDANPPSTTLHIDSRSVLVDVVVTDKNGKPVPGLKQDAFTVTEQGKPQAVSFFEEHTGAGSAPKEMPKLPQDVFSNFSPYAQPAAVNVLLLDSLNTRIESQTVVHQQAMKFLKDLKPGSRMAVFTMDLGLHFIQGFTDDPALLFAALGNKKNNEVQNSVMLKGQAETNAEAELIGMMSQSVGPGGATAAPAEMTADLMRFINENDTSKETDRALLTLANLQRLATFLNGFPGRKNVIWFSESPAIAQRVDQQIGKEWEKTQNMLAAARVAIYPVDARGVATVGFYQADSQLPNTNSTPTQILGPPPAGGNSNGGESPTAGASSNSGGSTGAVAGSIAGTSPGSGGLSSSGAQSTLAMNEAAERDAEQSMMKEIANDTGGRAFMNTNGLSQVMAKITADSADFYTLAYAPTDERMDGAFRKIDVKIAGGNFNVSYRRGYYARDAGLPGGELVLREKALHKLAAENPGTTDPLLPLMDLGMPQSEQILYTAKIVPVAAKAGAGDAEQDKKKSGGQAYTVDFSIVLEDLDLKLDSDGLHKGMLNVSLIAYDKYGKIAARKDHLVALNIKPDVFAVYEQKGVQLHADFEVPKGQYWLRTGVYDQGSRKAGTMEIALDTVVPLLPTAPLQSSVPWRDSPKDSANQHARTGQKVTVEQLEQKLAAAQGKKDQDVAKRLSGMELSERLDSEKLAKIEAGLPGEKSRMALMVMTDASAFLPLPTAEIPTTAPPDVATERLILQKATESVVASIHKFPDFIAQRTTNRFHDLKLQDFSSNAEPIILEHQPFQPLDKFIDTVYYRNGQEMDGAAENRGTDKPVPHDGLSNWGVFGPLQRIVMTDIYKGKIGWGHWEQRSTGPVAVFRYAVPKEQSDYVVKYCCTSSPNEKLHRIQLVPAFHGEIAIDAATGAVYRVVIINELSPSDPIFQADIMVEYEPVEIGGQVYICPSKSVSITTAISPIFYERCAGGVGVMTASDCSAKEAPRDTAINDTEYDSYHVFRSEMRIVPEGDAGQGTKTAPDGPGAAVPKP